MNLGRRGSLQPGLCYRRLPASRAADRRASSVSNKREFRSAVFPSWLPPTRLCDFLHQCQVGRNNTRDFRCEPSKINVIKCDSSRFPFFSNFFFKTATVLSEKTHIYKRNTRKVVQKIFLLSSSLFSHFINV